MTFLSATEIPEPAAIAAATNATAETTPGEPAPEITGKPSDDNLAEAGSEKAQYHFGAGAPKAKQRGPHGRFTELDVAERERIRKSLQQVLGDPAVTEARKELRAATENLKATLRSAIASEDPELAPMLQKMLKKGAPGRPGQYLNRTPGTRWNEGIRQGDFPRGPDEALQRDIFPRILDARRQELREAHRDTLDEPALREALKELTTTSSSPEEKHALRKKLRESYLDEMEKRIPGLRELLKQGPAPRHSHRFPVPADNAPQAPPSPPPAPGTNLQPDPSEKD